MISAPINRYLKSIRNCCIVCDWCEFVTTLVSRLYPWSQVNVCPDRLLQQVALLLTYYIDNYLQLKRFVLLKLDASKILPSNLIVECKHHSWETSKALHFNAANNYLESNMKQNLRNSIDNIQINK